MDNETGRCYTCAACGAINCLVGLLATMASRLVDFTGQGFANKKKKDVLREYTKIRKKQFRSVKNTSEFSETPRYNTKK